MNHAELDSVEPRVLVLGIGNVLWADEGFGVRAVEAFDGAWEVPGNVTVMDGGTQGLFLVPYVMDADWLVIFDAIDFGLPPGEMRLIRDDQVPSYMGAKKVSMHQTGFQEVLASARLAGSHPERIALIGVQPVVLDDYGGSLRPAVKARVPAAVELAAAVLAEWGVPLTRRAAPPAPAERISVPELDMARYEAGRPPPEDNSAYVSPVYDKGPKP
jgi:hydrogenase maturation protease